MGMMIHVSLCFKVVWSVQIKKKPPEKNKKCSLVWDGLIIFVSANVSLASIERGGGPCWFVLTYFIAIGVQDTRFARVVAGLSKLARSRVYEPQDGGQNTSN